MKNKKMIIGMISAFLCETLYGSSYLFTKNALDVAGAFSILGWRFFIAFAVMLICALLGIIKLDLKNKNIKPLVLFSTFSPCLYFIGETVGINNTTASESGVFLACIPVISLFASTLVLKKRPSNLQIAGITITLTGVIITVVTLGVSSSLSIVGYSFLTMAVISYVIFSIFVEKHCEYTGTEITFVMMMVGSAVFVSIAVVQALLGGTFKELLTLPFREPSFAVAVLYQGIFCSIIAFFLTIKALAYIGVNKTASFIGISTVVSVLSGALILKEPFTLYQVIGAVIILAGVYTANADSFSK